MTPPARTPSETWSRAFELIRQLGNLQGDALVGEALARCDGDPALETAVRSLLDSHDADGDGILREVDAELGLGGTPEPDDFPTVDGVELTRLLGRGGSGDVYAGRQRSPEREVAVKVLRSGVTSRRAVHRFAREGRALAAIQHPSVAAIYAIAEAKQANGAVAPCLIMEYVPGHTLTESDTPMSVRDAALLAARIARGLHAAHQRGIVHRDLKPSNVLIDADGNPRIIDFGIAALRSADDTARHTITGELLGTLAYMSPEQIDGTPDVADVRIDVYSVGVVFYELVTGTSAVETRTGSSLAAIQSIVEGNLPKLLTGGDADAIYRKATATEASQRYDSAAALADDLERLAEGRPVSARPPSLRYTASRFIRRHPWSVAAGTAAVCAVLTLSAAATIGFMSASRERDAALIAESRASEASAFLRGMLASPNPDGDGPDVKVVDLLDRSASQIDALHMDDPLVAMDLHRTLGWTYASLSEHADALEHLNNATDLARDQLTPDHPELLELETNLAESELQVGEIEAALSRIEGVVARVTSATDLPVHTVGAALTVYGEALRSAGRSDDATSALVQAQEVLASIGDETDAQHRAALSALGRIYLEQSLAADARTVYETLLATFATDEHSSPSWLIARSNYAMALAAEGRHAEAVPIYESILDTGPPVLGEMHFTLRMVRNILPDSYFETGQPDRALVLSRRAVKDAAAVYGAGTLGELTALNNLAVLLMQLERFEEARPLTERMAAELPVVLGSEHPRALTGLRNHGTVLDKLGQDTEAAAVFRSIIDVQRATLGDAHFDTIVSKNNLAHLLETIGESEEAVELMQSVVDHSGPESGLPPPARGIFQLNLGRSLVSIGEYDLAETALRAALELYPGNEAHRGKVEDAQRRLTEARAVTTHQNGRHAADPGSG